VADGVALAIAGPGRRSRRGRSSAHIFFR
jgi:hypothetical protein